MSDELYDKTEALLKGLLSVKSDSMRTAAVKGQGIKAPKLPSKLPDVKPPKIKGPSIPKISATPPKPKGLPTSPEKAAEAVKVPGGLPPPSKKDPAAVAAQLTRPDQTKLVAAAGKEEVIKTDRNGQWSLEKAVLDPAHGITFQHEHHDLGGDGDLTHVRAVHPVHGTVGEAMYQHQPDGSLQFTDVTTHPEWRRMGIASGMTQHAMGVTGKTIGSHTPTTDAGSAFKQGAIAQNPVAAKQLK